MNIRISTKVRADAKSVINRFDVYLFKALKPPLAGMKIERFDGCKKGDKVHVEINTLGWRQKWKALITDNGEDENEIYFVDEGLQLPKPLKKWHHKHEIRKFIDSSIIIDNIMFSSGNILIDLMLYPLLFIQFYYRKRVYKSYFG